MCRKQLYHPHSQSTVVHSMKGIPQNVFLARLDQELGIISFGPNLAVFALFHFKAPL